MKKGKIQNFELEHEKVWEKCNYKTIIGVLEYFQA